MKLWNGHATNTGLPRNNTNHVIFVEGLSVERRIVPFIDEYIIRRIDMTNSWTALLKHDWRYFLRAGKDRFVLKFLKKCPCCFSKRIHFVEGDQMEKWFCKDCMAMHYKMSCPHCTKPFWFFTHYKQHIFQEYRLGKFRKAKTFWKKTTREYIHSQILFHREALDHWHEINLKFLRRQKRMKYGGRF